jgi:glutathione synthase/RimK-type ligase-like ATP-grasp enzyme
MTMRLAGIRRKTEFSPNHVVNDSLIIHATGDALRALGAEVVYYDEGTVTPDTLNERVVFSMAQGPAGSATLVKVEDTGALIINSPRSVMNCYRTSMVKLLPEAGVPFPRSVIISTDAVIDPREAGFDGRKVWVKRGDVHAVHKEDVTLASTRDEMATLLREFYSRDIRQAILQEHLEGDTVKFYAVRETDLFHWYYLNGVHKTPFEAGKLREIASAAAEILGPFIYGGDAIIGLDGGITIIDINDWPSFAPVRDDASRAIAELVFRKAQHYLNSHA